VKSRQFFVTTGESAHPSRKSRSIRIFGEPEDEEHFIPVFAITSVSKNGWQ
jgi:hypothetical protein